MSYRRIVGIGLAGCLVFSLAWAQDEPSVAELQAKVKAEPDSGADWYALGRALQDRREYDAALAAFDRAIELEFQPAGAWMRSAQVMAAKGDVEGALDDLERAATTSPAALAVLPQIGGIPELEGDPRLQELLDAAEEARHPCKKQSESRQFDFWIGAWSVTDPQGQVVGENMITRDLAGCVIREAWTDAYGNRGTSVNFYHPASDRWHQIWTSENGTVTHYEGTWSDGAMRFQETGFGDADSESRRLRMTFTPNPDGSVRQLIESTEDGTSWTVSFDGLYRKKPASD